MTTEFLHLLIPGNFVGNRQSVVENYRGHNKLNVTRFLVLIFNCLSTYYYFFKLQSH